MGVHQIKHGVERRTEPAGLHFEDKGLIFFGLEFKLVHVFPAVDATVDDERRIHRVCIGRRIVRLCFGEFGQFPHVEQDRIGKAAGCVGADFLLAERRVRFDFQFHFAESIKVASPKFDFDWLPAPASERKYTVQIRQFAGDDAVLIVLSALVTAVADFQKVFAVFRRLEIYQRIEAIDFFTPGDFLARRVQQGQRRIQG